MGKGRGKDKGPTYGSSTAPLIASAGKDHVVFSKKLVLVISLILLVTLFVFFSVEQSLISGNLAQSRQALAQNNAIRSANEQLEDAKGELQDEEDELVSMYSKWLDEDSEELEISKEELAELKEQLKTVNESISSHGDALSEKEEALAEKENRLHSYQFKIQQKQNYLDQMAEVLRKLNHTNVPNTDIDADPDAFVWDDQVEGLNDDYYTEYYTGDDDWMSDEEWY